MKYKVGQKVKLKKYEKRFKHQSPTVIYSMREIFGQYVTIKEFNPRGYFSIKEYKGFVFNTEWIECGFSILPDYLFKM